MNYIFDSKVINKKFQLRRSYTAKLKFILLFLALVPIFLAILNFKNVYNTINESIQCKFNAKNYLENVKYPKYKFKHEITKEEFSYQYTYKDGTCHNDFNIILFTTVILASFFIIYLIIPTGYSFQMDKRRRIIYTKFYGDTYVYRIPANIKDVEYNLNLEHMGEKLLSFPMTNIKNDQIVYQTANTLFLVAKEQNKSIQEFIECYFCKRNQNTDDKWLLDAIDLGSHLNGSLLYNIFIRPCYFSLWKNTDLKSPQLLSQIDAYLKENPSFEAEDDFVPETDIYNQI
jgi:hypothetical protein